MLPRPPRTGGKLLAGESEDKMRTMKPLTWQSPDPGALVGKVGLIPREAS